MQLYTEDSERETRVNTIAITERGLVTNCNEIRVHPEQEISANRENRNEKWNWPGIIGLILSFIFMVFFIICIKLNYNLHKESADLKIINSDMILAENKWNSSYAELEGRYKELSANYSLLGERYRTLKLDYNHLHIGDNKRRKRELIENTNREIYKAINNLEDLKKRMGILEREERLIIVRDNVVKSKKLEIGINTRVTGSQDFILLDSLNHKFIKYSSSDGGSTYEYVLNEHTFGNSPKRGAIISGDIYILPDQESNIVGIYNLSSLGHPLFTISQEGGNSACDTYGEGVICVDDLGYIYIYTYTTTYDQQLVQGNLPKGAKSILSMRNGNIVITQGGYIYIYGGQGAYIHHFQATSLSEGSPQMDEGKLPGHSLVLIAQGGNLILTDISNPYLPFTYILLDGSNRETDYQTVIVLDEGMVAVGGSIYIDTGDIKKGYLKLFKLDAENARVELLHGKLWVGDEGCQIQVIRELKEGVIGFAGNIHCLQVCIWEYLSIFPPACFPLASTDISDLIPLTTY